MKKILISTPWFLPAFRAGGPIRSIANLVNSYEGAEFFIFTSDTDITGAALENIHRGKWVKWNNHTHVWYATDGKVSHEMTRQVELLKPDVIFMIGLYSWHFTIVPLLYCKAPLKIISVRGMLYPEALSQKKWKKRIFLRAFKLLEYNHRVVFHATDQTEAQHVETMMGSVAKVRIAGNFPTFVGYRESAPKRKDALKLVTIALVSPMKNILKTIEALSTIAEAVDYEIYGAIKDEDYWTECKRAIEQLPENIKVEYRNALHPERVPEVLSRSQVFILPSESENFGHAIFESLSAGRPVITSNNTPFNSLKEHKAGINVSSDSKEEITDAIQFFIAMDNQEFVEWSHAALTYARSCYDEERLRKEYGELWG